MERQRGYEAMADFPREAAGSGGETGRRRVNCWVVLAAAFFVGLVAMIIWLIVATLDVQSTVSRIEKGEAFFAPAGTVISLVSSSNHSDAQAIPAGWVPCDGVRHKRLDGKGWITAPDLRGRFLVAAGQSASAPSLPARQAGEFGGVVRVSLAVNNLPSHTHEVEDPGHSHSSTRANAYIFRVPGGASNPSFTGPLPGTTGMTKSNISIGNTGAGAPFDVVNPFFSMLFVMKI